MSTPTDTQTSAPISSPPSASQSSPVTPSKNSASSAKDAATIPLPWSPLVWDHVRGVLAASPDRLTIDGGTGHSPATDILQQFWTTSNFCDLTLKLKDGHELKVNKLIVNRCSFFKAACTLPFKEALENCIQFPDDEPAAMIGVAMHLYGFTIEQWGHAVFGLKVSYACNFKAAIALYKSALKYDLPKLASDVVALFDKDTSRYLSRKCAHSSPGWLSKLVGIVLRTDEDRSSSPFYKILVREVRKEWQGIVMWNEEALRKAFGTYPWLAVDLLIDHSVRLQWYPKEV